MLEALMIGDPHIDKAKPYPNYVEVAIQTLQSILGYAKNEGIQKIFLLGDIFETPYPNDQVKMKVLQLLDDSYFTFYIILGNHEWSSNEANSLELLSYLANTKYANVKIFLKPTCKIIDGIRFQFLPFPQETAISSKPSICLAHTGFDGFETDSGKPIKGVKLDKRHTWFVGHLHTRQGDIYPGSILQNNFGEKPDKYFFHIVVKNESVVKVKAVPIPQPFKLLKAVIKSDSDWSKLKSDQQIYYKLDVKNDVVVPANIEQKINICNLSYFRREEELVNENDLVINQEEMEICDPTLYLSAFLKKKGLKKQERCKAKQIIKNILKGTYNVKKS